MTKQIRIEKLPGTRMNESELRFLQLLARHGGTMVASVAEVGASVGLRPESTRCMIRKLRDSGYVEFHTRYLSNGGQLENEYLLTASARRVLSAWDEQQKEAQPLAVA